MNAWLIGLFIGGISGAVAALCGVGGGIILVPVFAQLLGWDQKSSLAASLIVVLPTVAAATYRNIGNGFPDWKTTDWRIVTATAIGATLVAFLAADWMKSFQNEQLKLIFGILLVVVGLQMILFR